VAATAREGMKQHAANGEVVSWGCTLHDVVAACLGDEVPQRWVGEETTRALGWGRKKLLHKLCMVFCERLLVVHGLIL